MTRIELIIALDAAAKAVAHGGSAAVGTFRPSDCGTAVPAERYASASAALAAAEAGLRALAHFLAPTDAEFASAGLIVDGCWYGASVWN